MGVIHQGTTVKEVRPSRQLWKTIYCDQELKALNLGCQTPLFCAFVSFYFRKERAGDKAEEMKTAFR